MIQLVQIVGAVVILAAFALAQFGLVGQRSYLFLALNLGGAVVLAVVAYVERQWGFLLLEVAWAAVSAWGLGRRVWPPVRAEPGTDRRSL